MIKLTSLILGATLISGCLPMGGFEITPTGDAASFEVPTIISGNCGAEAHQNLLNQSESVLDGVTLPEGTRIIHPGTVFIHDVDSSRLNIGIAADGQIVYVSCG